MTTPNLLIISVCLVLLALLTVANIPEFVAYAVTAVLIVLIMVLGGAAPLLAKVMEKFNHLWPF